MWAKRAVMIHDKIGLEKLSERDQLWIACIDAEKHAKQNGHFRSTSSPMTETEVLEVDEGSGSRGARSRRKLRRPCFRWPAYRSKHDSPD